MSITLCLWKRLPHSFQIWSYQNQFLSVVSSAWSTDYKNRKLWVEPWHLNSALWTVTLDLPSFVSGLWEPLAELTKREERKNILWGKTTNLSPQLVLIPPCWVYFIPTHKQSLAQRRWKGKTQMKDACWTTGSSWDLLSLSDNEQWLSWVLTSVAAFAWKMYSTFSVRSKEPHLKCCFWMETYMWVERRQMKPSESAQCIANRFNKTIWRELTCNSVIKW